MDSYFRWVRVTLAVVSLVLFASMSDVRAADGGTITPCGNFNFAAGATCKIEVSGGCTADCSPLSFEAACTGMCNASSNTTCVDDCGTTCIAMCDPAALDCFVGCHAECDDPTIAACKQKHPTDDCAKTARAQCDVHCKDSCQVPPSNCQEHCTKCCTGSCTTQVNFDCDFSCFADVRGGCEVQCQKPEGGIFCNGQYVHTSDVAACIRYLATQGINVDVSAQGSARCDLHGCDSVTSSKGCSLSRSSPPPGGTLAWALAGLLAAMWRTRRAVKRC